MGTELIYSMIINIMMTESFYDKGEHQINVFMLKLKDKNQ